MDMNDVHQQKGPEAVREIINAAQKPEPVNAKPKLNGANIAEFLAMHIPPREEVLSPIMQTQSLAMIFAMRGVGKTHFALGIAYAIASGGQFLNWTAPKPRSVLYIDGEMPAKVMQERLAEIVKRSEAQADAGSFTILTPDMQPHGMPDISTPEGQAALEPFIEAAEVIVVDNISTLARTGKENEAEGWLSVQEWALRMRSRGKSVLFVHHAGKGGEQRGTSRREDVLDLVLRLKRPEDYKAEQGARFEVHFDKARHLMGDAAKPFEAMLTYYGWTIKTLEDAELKRVLALHEEGLSLREIEHETGISKSRVARMVKSHEQH